MDKSLHKVYTTVFHGKGSFFSLDKEKNKGKVKRMEKKEASFGFWILGFFILGPNYKPTKLFPGSNPETFKQSFQWYKTKTLF